MENNQNNLTENQTNSQAQQPVNTQPVNDNLYNQQPQQMYNQQANTMYDANQQQVNYQPMNNNVYDQQPQQMYNQPANIMYGDTQQPVNYQPMNNNVYDQQPQQVYNQQTNTMYGDTQQPVNYQPMNNNVYDQQPQQMYNQQANTMYDANQQQVNYQPMNNNMYDQQTQQVYEQSTTNQYEQIPPQVSNKIEKVAKFLPFIPVIIVAIGIVGGVISIVLGKDFNFNFAGFSIDVNNEDSTEDDLKYQNLYNDALEYVKSLVNEVNKLENLVLTDPDTAYVLKVSKNEENGCITAENVSEYDDLRVYIVVLFKLTGFDYFFTAIDNEGNYIELIKHSEIQENLADSFTKAGTQYKYTIIGSNEIENGKTMTDLDSNILSTDTKSFTEIVKQAEEQISKTSDNTIAYIKFEDAINNEGVKLNDKYYNNFVLITSKSGDGFCEYDPYDDF